MKARQEFVKWAYKEKYLAMDGKLEEAYIAGFKRAVELVEEILKRQGECDDVTEI
jgi:hypothetical protein